MTINIKNAIRVNPISLISFLAMCILFILPMIWDFAESLNAVYSIIFLITITCSLWTNLHYLVKYKPKRRFGTYGAITISLAFLLLYGYYFLVGMIDAAVLQAVVSSGGMR